MSNPQQCDYNFDTICCEVCIQGAVSLHGANHAKTGHVKHSLTAKTGPHTRRASYSGLNVHDPWETYTRDK